MEQVFSIVRKIYQKKIYSIFYNIRGDLVEVIGTIVGSEKINYTTAEIDALIGTKDRPIS